MKYIFCLPAIGSTVSLHAGPRTPIIRFFRMKNCINAVITLFGLHCPSNVSNLRLTLDNKEVFWLIASTAISAAGIRPLTTVEGIMTLKTYFKDATVMINMG